MKTSVIRYILAICFLLSGGLKLVSLHTFEEEVRLYGDAYIGEWVSTFSVAIAFIVCMTEISVAFLALLKRFEIIAAVAFFILLLFFVYLTGTNLFFPTIMGSIESCGCFGEFIHFTPVGAFTKSSLLWIMSCINLYTTFPHPIKR